MSTIPADTARVLRSLGWVVHAKHAIHEQAGVVRRVNADGTWTVKRGSQVLGTGRETHPALAACDANEVAWAALQGATR